MTDFEYFVAFFAGVLGFIVAEVAMKFENQRRFSESFDSGRRYT